MKVHIFFSRSSQRYTLILFRYDLRQPYTPATSEIAVHETVPVGSMSCADTCNAVDCVEIVGGLEISDNSGPTGKIEMMDASDDDAPTDEVEMMEASDDNAPSDIMCNKEAIDENKPSTDLSRLRELVCTSLNILTCCA